MPIFRATVWTLSAAAEVVEGDAGIQRRIVELEVLDRRDFEATVRDWYIHDVDNQVWFGPISEKRPEDQVGWNRRNSQTQP